MKDVIAKAKKAVKMFIDPGLVKPLSARLVVTVNCNFRCQMCTFWCHPHWTPELKKDPSLELVKHWIKSFSEFGIKEIEIGGGEALLRPDFTEILNTVHSYGMTAGVTTNGWLVGGEIIPFPKVDAMEISIDGAKPETHDKIRGIKGAFERAIKTIEIAKKNGCTPRLNFVIQKDNYLELIDYCKLAKELGVEASFIPVSLDLDGQPHLPEALAQYDIAELKEQIMGAMETGVVQRDPAFMDNFFRRTKEGPSPQKCLAPYRCILIFNNGDVYPCGAFDKPVGNLSMDREFKDIWKEYEGLRKQVWAGKYKFCDKCVYGDIWNRKTILAAALPYLKRRFSKKT